MRAIRTFNTAIRALRRNVMRAVLTTLGIVIGVGAVIAMMEIGQGSSSAMQKQVASMGANTLMVWPGQAFAGGISSGAGSSVNLKPEDCDAILTECPSVKAAAPIVRGPRVQLIYGNKNYVPQTVQGTTPAFLDVRDWENLADGASFTDIDVNSARKVCLIGQTVQKQLFGTDPAVGKEIRFNNVSFIVVGVLSKKGANMMGQDQDDVVIAPWTTIKYRLSNQFSGGSGGGGSSSASSSTSDTVNSLSNLYPSSGVALYPARNAIQAADQPMPVRFANIDQIIAAASGPKTVQSAVDEVSSLLRERHHLASSDADDFTLRNMTELADTLGATSALMTKLLLAVALISLVVGGVGIMNIMLVSVTERTREIGLRMAVGARGRDILRQFLVESVLLCLIGGALGILLGSGTSFLVTFFLKWPTEASPAAVVAAIVVSATVGIAFGYYPAWKASRLDPIDALRYE